MLGVWDGRITVPVVIDSVANWSALYRNQFLHPASTGDFRIFRTDGGRSALRTLMIFC